MKRRRRYYPPQHLYNIEPAPQPAPAPNWLTQLGGNIPMPFVIAALVGAAIWYGTTNTKQDNTQDVVKDLKTKIEDISKTTVTSTKEQDDRRATMAKEFLASNREIATKVGDLATAVAVQQATQKSIFDALAKVSDQLGVLARQSAPVR